MSTLALKVPPFALLAMVGGCMALTARAAPAATLAWPGRLGCSFGLAAAGVSIALAGVVSFRRAKTTVNPLQPTAASALVTSGVYQWTRNPMYLGALFILLAWAAFLANVIALIFVPAFVLYLNHFQIAPEEQALTSLFGAEFTDYCARVRRWI